MPKTFDSQKKYFSHHQPQNEQQQILTNTFLHKIKRKFHKNAKRRKQRFPHPTPLNPKKKKHSSFRHQNATFDRGNTRARPLTPRTTRARSKKGRFFSSISFDPTTSPLTPTERFFELKMADYVQTFHNCDGKRTHKFTIWESPSYSNLYLSVGEIEGKKTVTAISAVLDLFSRVETRLLTYEKLQIHFRCRHYKRSIHYLTRRM